MWSVGANQGELVVDEIDAGPVHGDLFLEFHCPACEELHSVKCTCASKAETSRSFFCSCVPVDCPSCEQRMTPERAALLLVSAV